MIKKKRGINPFLKKIFIYFIGVFSTKILSVLLVPIYAYYVKEDALGDFDYIVALANLIAPVFYLALWEAVLKLCIKEDDSDKINKVLSSVLIYFVTASFIVLGIFVLLFVYFSFDFKYLFILASVVLCGATSIWQFAARALKNNRAYVVSSVLGSVSLIILDILFIFSSSLDFYGLCISHIVSQLVIIVSLEFVVKLFKRIRIKRIDFKLFKSMVIFCFPLAINSVSLWAYTSGSKLIIENLIGSSENGLYSFAAKFSLLISFFSSILSLAVIEDAYSCDSLETYRIKMKKIIGFISKGYFCLILLALPAIYILYEIAFKNTGYYNSAEYIFFLLLTALFTALSNNFGSSFQVTNKTNYILFTTIVGAALSIIVSLILINVLSIYGVLIGATIGSFTMMLLRAVYAYRATGLSISWGANIFILLLTVFEWIIYKLNNSIFVQIVIFALAIIAVTFFYRKELKKLSSYFKNRRNKNA